MKVFNRAEFLSSKCCEICLSNGSKFMVKDLSDAAMDHISKIDETSDMNQVRNAVALALGTDVDKIKDIGVVELQGALGFLSESLFAQK